ncbi:10142_t:CDS:2, partial [Cetraspora pellucida]
MDCSPPDQEQIVAFSLFQTQHEEIITNSQDNDTNYLSMSPKTSFSLNIFMTNNISKEQLQCLFDFDSSDQKSDAAYLRQLCGNEIYIPRLQQINFNQMKYRQAQGIMCKMIDLVLDTNSYEEMIGICQEFMFNKQQILNKYDHEEQ